MPDVSLVLALHHEGHYLHRTLLSLAEAANYARRVGITTELIAVLDRPDTITEAALTAFEFDAFESHAVLRVDNGSPGPTRNDGCRAARGTYIATADGDDLISFNYIERMFWRAEQIGPRAILVPEFIFAFGDNYHIAELFGLDQVTPLALLSDNPFVSRVFFHHLLSKRLAYHDVSLTHGYAYEDWHFNCNAITLDYNFYAAEETILFYRQRRDSLLREGARISIRQIPPSPMFQPSCYERICGPWIDRLAAASDPRSMVSRKGNTILHNPSRPCEDALPGDDQCAGGNRVPRVAPYDAGDRLCGSR